MFKKKQKKLNKKGLEFLSWVLLIAFSVAIGTFVFIWMRGFAEKEMGQITKVVYDTQECSSVSVRTDTICQDLAVIKLNITNNNKRDVNRLIFRLYDLYGNPETRDINITLKPDEQQYVRVIKQGTTKKLEIIPSTFRDELQSKKTEIIC